MIEIPLNSSPEQLFSIVLNEESYDVRVVLSSRTGIWTLSLSQNGVDIITGVALVGGVDIFEQYPLPIQNAYVVNIEDPSLDPSKTNLGTSARLFILTDEEVA